MAHDWQENHDEFLRERYAAGATFANISAGMLNEFNVDVSKNSCIGRAHRIGLKSERRIGAVIRNKTPSSAISTGRAAAAAQKINRADGPVRLKSDPFRCRSADVVPLNLSVLELTDATCKYAVTETSPHLFCGNPVLEAPYCVEHSRLCFNGLPAKKPQREYVGVSAFRFGGGRAA